MIRTEVLSNPSEAAHLTEEWARLAHDCARPYCNPEWMLAWWAHVAPRTARLNVVAVHDDDRLVGLAPFYFHSTGRGGRYRLLATGTSLRGDVLAVPGLERAVARAVAAAIGGSSPVALEGIAAASPFVGLLEGQGPGAAVTEWSIRAPVLRLEGRPFDQWLAGKSANF